MGLFDDLAMPERMDEGDARGAEGAVGGGKLRRILRSLGSLGSLGHGHLPDGFEEPRLRETPSRRGWPKPHARRQRFS